MPACLTSKGTAKIMIQGTDRLLKTVENQYGGSLAPYFLAVSRSCLQFARDEYNRGDFKTAEQVSTAAYVYASRAFQLSQLPDEGERLLKSALFEKEKDFSRVLAEYAGEKKQLMAEFRAKEKEQKAARRKAKRPRKGRD